MKANATCPFCEARATEGCQHLALCAAPGDFVTLCIEQSGAQSQWRALCQTEPQADFAWLESSFSERFLKPLRWHGTLEYEWRTREDRKTREQVAMLWSKDPQHLWWELRDLIAAQADSVRPRASTAVIRCPVCAKSLRDTECEHLILHGDDLTTEDVINLFNPQGAWSKLKSANPAIPEDAATFLRQFERSFPSLAGVERHPWGDDAFGFGEHYVFIWVKKLETFEQELGKFVRAH